MGENQKSDKCNSVVILAAGQSTRMGRPKFALKFDENLTFLEKIITGYNSFGCRQIIVVLNEEGETFLKNNPIKLFSNITIVTNFHPEWERFYSIKIGLRQLNEFSCVFIHNVDNPFVNKQVLKSLQGEMAETDYVVPCFKGRGGHPVLLSKKMIKHIIAEKNPELNFRDFLKRHAKKMVEVEDESVLVNVNTSEDYKRLKKLPDK
ncbi:MAG: NTP transferase domain-containing protein [Bacteroidales bacterium]|nr:NTP transferase domain-containing protein [Bacteroidales bacterium]